MNAQKQQRIVISGDPAARIRYLETVYNGKDWSATVIFPHFGKAPDGSTIDSVKQMLAKGGYTTSTRTDEYGNQLLDIHHIGHDTAIFDIFRAKGMMGGSAYLLDDIGMPLNRAFSFTGDYLKWIANDPARILGGVYLLGDAVSIAMGLGNKDHANSNTAPSSTMDKLKSSLQEIKQPKNFLQSYAGIAATIQSLIFMKYAKSGSDMALEDLQGDFRKCVMQHDDPMNVQKWSKDKPVNGMFARAMKWITDNPLEAGAATIISGQLGFLASAFMHHNDNSRLLKAATSPTQIKSLEKAILGNKINMLRGPVSIAAWMALLHDPKPVNENSSWWDRIMAQPEKVSSILLGGASLIGLAGGKLTGNHMQAGSEGLWLAGDVAMYFTKKHSYGAAGQSNKADMIDAGTRFMADLPLAQGPVEQAQFVKELAHSLASRFCHADKKADEQTIHHTAHEIETGIAGQLQLKPTAFHKLCATSARLVEQFPVEKKEAVINAIATGLSGCYSVQASAEELAQAIRMRVQPTWPGVTRIVNPQLTEQALGNVVFSFPNAMSGEIAMALHDHLKPFLPRTIDSAEKMQVSLTKQAGQSLGMPPHIIQAMNSNLTAGQHAARV